MEEQRFLLEKEEKYEGGAWVPLNIIDKRQTNLPWLLSS